MNRDMTFSQMASEALFAAYYDEIDVGDMMLTLDNAEILYNTVGRDEDVHFEIRKKYREWVKLDAMQSLRMSFFTLP